MRPLILSLAAAMLALMPALPAGAERNRFESHAKDSLALEQICEAHFAKTTGENERLVRSRSEDTWPPGHTKVTLWTVADGRRGVCIINIYGRIRSLDPFLSE